MEREIKGIITDIQRFSTHDGPGIRTTVFLKGCNMSCFWCHNYENISSLRQLQYDETKCIGCMECFKICPVGAHVIKQGKHLIDREKCISCMKCTEICFSMALQVVGEIKSAGEIFDTICEDQDFYEISGGGVTLSGGEVMMQQKFATAILRLCKGKGVHTAIETNMAWPWEQVVQLIENVDLVMMDIKAMDSRLHKTATGVNNELVLENVKNLASTNIPLIVRTPIIKGFNDNSEEIKKIANYIHDIKNLRYYELLTYNPLGSEKPKLLGAYEKVKKINPLTKVEMKKLGYCARDSGIRVLINGKELSSK